MLWVIVGLLTTAWHAAGCSSAPQRGTHGSTKPPNIILIVADDLGRGELGCYGQKIIKTPTIDGLAAGGLKFTNAYAGSCVCAPSRCTILTGLHTGHAAIRDNRELKPVGQEPLPDASVTIADLLQKQGYATALVGKWGLGPPGSEGDPSRHGFDHFFGYYCQRHAHNHCPTYLYRNLDRIEIPGNKDQWSQGELAPGATYAPDLMREEALGFISANADKPFFLMFSTPVSHAALQVPEDSLAEYRGVFDDPPYDGKKGYLKHESPRAAYAAMVSRFDRDVGVLLARLKELGIDRNTLVVITSDNGPTYNGGTDSAFFESAKGFKGLKGQLYEGGIRTPLIMSWPGRIAPGTESSFVTASWDFFPTFAALGQAPTSGLKLDGVDLTSLLISGKEPSVRPTCYWEYSSGGGWQAVRMGEFKAVRRQARKQGGIEVYDLSVDPAETRDLAKERPDVVAAAREVMNARRPSSVADWELAAVP